LIFHFFIHHHVNQHQRIHQKNISIYDLTQEGVLYPQMPQFDNFESERQHRKQRLVAACRAFALDGLDYGFAGLLTIRDPEHPELYWTNPMCVHFSQVRLSNLILVDHKGVVVQGTYAVNRAGLVLHAAAHAANPDILALCHAHSVYGTAFFSASRHSIEAAAFWFIALECCCKQQLMVQASGHKPVLVSPERARCSKQHVGSEYIRWLHFQPIYEHLVVT
jgi:ribulose-5-phosphate 4-epimerase/fuculose-1-phosphate aldolase